jgi:hypothetical protein
VCRATEDSVWVVIPDQKELLLCEESSTLVLAGLGEIVDGGKDLNVKTLAEGNVGSVRCELDECLDDTGVDGDDNGEVDQRGVVAKRRLYQLRWARSIVASRFPDKNALNAIFAVGDPELFCGWPLVTR